MTNSTPPNQLIPSQTGLTLRRTDTLINLTHKLLAHTGGKGIGQMSDDELWEWWLSLSDEWKWLFLRYGLELDLWQNDDREFNKAYDYQADFDWLNRNLSLHYVKQLQGLTELGLGENQIQNIAPLANLTQLTELWLYDNQIQDITPLSNLTQLTRLDLDINQIQDITPLANLTQLTYLHLSKNPIKPQDIDWLQQKLPDCEIFFKDKKCTPKPYLTISHSILSQN
ncbi:leucine-rich repeat domain-containing protein [Moraxella sp. Pampa]|uniref:leucine-rich repeat domain-containing protein n=1 Tax=Moraxella sp. Pampa TaxID=3111978 RepID=UPI002B402177|nr:leucine-rich repeat domain-containing protein [Moraxella sp. Pampa]